MAHRRILTLATPQQHTLAHGYAHPQNKCKHTEYISCAVSDTGKMPEKFLA